jgi:hypothetical protein
MKITERLDIVADNMWNRGNWGSDLDTVKDAKEHIEKLENILRKVFPEKSGHYFICGELGNQDNNGLPEKIEICPAYGCDWSQIYERADKTIGGMGS